MKEEETKKFEPLYEAYLQSEKYTTLQKEI